MKKSLPLFFLVLISAICQAQKISLLGTTRSGGSNDSGTLFSYNTSTGKQTVLHTFGGGTAGAFPYGSLIKASNNLFYGTTSDGGVYNLGTLFSFNDSTGIVTDLYDFGDYYYDGNNPFGSLLQVNDSLLCGLTAYGGSSGIYGTIFSYNILTGAETILYNFGNGTDGEFPYGSLIMANNSSLYGMTMYGGKNDGGVIFSYNIATNQETDLYNFNIKGVDGYNPNGSLIQANNGLLYGLTNVGGFNDSDVVYGAIFSFNTSTGAETDLHNFKDTANDGSSPYGSLLQANNGSLYGMTQKGGANGSGTLFSYNISTGAEIDIHNFGKGTDGKYPYNSLIQANDGLLYGTTEKGGTNNEGTIFNFNISTGKETDILDFDGINGGLPFGDLIEDDSTKEALNVLESSRNNFAIFPNPSNGIINVISGVTIDEIKVTDVLGRIIYASTPKQNRISLTIAERGIYYVALTSGTQIITKKVIIEY